MEKNWGDTPSATLNIYSLYSHDDPTLGLEPPNLEDHEFLKLFIGLC